MTDEVKTGNDVSFRDIAEGYIRFNIKAEDTEENQQTHDAFKEFCKVETDNNYTLGLRKLLEYYQGDFKYELMNDKLNEQIIALQDLKGSFVSFTTKSEAPNKEEKGLF